ncbi:Fc.00g043910.m01.CDS01 [Cosmosporella sp. VM-42]
MRVPIQNNEKEEVLPIREQGDNVGRPASGPSPIDAVLRLEPVPDKYGLLVTVQPPKEPTKSIPHIPCDIVLVIDVSGSMQTAAPVPGEDPSENTGLSVLDLTKHAARTIIETMNENDRLGIVTFSSKAKVIQNLTCMTDHNKDLARKNVAGMQVKDATNLWHGILEGIKLFKDVNTSGKVPAIMVLTDGMPNHMCPPVGYVPKIRSMGPLPASLHTFGFGYRLRSGLLKSIAEIGGGNYAFIPDAGMIGTVFVHAVANLQSTFATKAVVKLTYSQPLELKETVGASVDQEAPEPVDSSPNSDMQLTLNLGNLQYGQSRDIFLRVRNITELKGEGADPSKAVITATLEYTKTSEISDRILFFNAFTARNSAVPPVVVSMQRSILDTTTLPDQTIAYHESRARICNFISSIFPMAQDGEHRADQMLLPTKREELDELISSLPGKQYLDFENMSLREDLAGEEPKGQISLAIRRDDYFNKWGCHYLPSLLNAHTRQICNSFKDSGPLQYGSDSPLFNSCKILLDNAFDNLPAPEPTVPATRHRGVYGQSRNASSSAPISMSRYRNISGVCFAASTDVTLASGRTVEIRRLRRGMKVRTPMGSRRVAMVLKTPVERELLCRVGKILVTPWHPISSDSKTWSFPANTAASAVQYTGAVYSVLLERSRNSAAHAIKVGDMWGVTLGHGLTFGNDVRAHAFFGDYNAVGKGLMKLEKGAKKGVVIGGGVERDGRTGLVMGFKGRKEMSV